MYWMLLGAALAADPQAADQVRDAIAAGDCEKALVVAKKAADASPRDPIAAKLQGDGWRCKGDTWRAVQAYRSAVALGSTDPGVPRLIDTLGKTLGAVKVTVSGYDAAFGVPVVTMARGADLIQPTVAAPPDFTFTDLPVGEPLEIRVSGPGIAAVVEPVAPLQKGQQAEKALVVVQQAPVLLVLAPWSSAATVELVQGTTKKPLAAGSHNVDPGTATLVITTANGTTTETVTGKPGDKVEVRVDDLVPGLLSVVGLPVGSAVTLTDSSGKALPVTVPDGPASMNDDVGLQVLGAVPVSGLRTGDYTLDVVHPVLGASRQSVLVVGGEVTPLRVDAKSFPNGPALQTAYAGWKAQTTAEKTGIPGKVWLAGGGTVASLGLATVGVLGTMAAGDRIEESRAAYDASVAAEDARGAREDYEAIGQAQNGRILPMVMAGAGGAGTAVFATVTVSGFSKAKKGRVHTPWVPESAITPAPPVSPAPAPAVTTPPTPAPETPPAPAPAPPGAP